MDWQTLAKFLNNKQNPNYLPKFRIKLERHVKISKFVTTRMHSSRMRTGRSLTVCRSLLPRGGVCFWEGVSAPRHVCFWGGVCSGLGSAGGGGCLLQGEGCVVSQHALRQEVSAPRGVSTPGGWYPSMH